MKPADIVRCRIVQRAAILGLITAWRDMKTDISVAVELFHDRQGVCNHGQPTVRQKAEHQQDGRTCIQKDSIMPLKFGGGGAG